MAFSLKEIEKQLMHHSMKHIPDVFNTFKKGYAIDEDIAINILNHGNHSTEDVNMYAKNLITCCTENNLCNNAIESIFANAYQEGIKDCLYTLYKNGLLPGVSS